MSDSWRIIFVRLFTIVIETVEAHVDEDLRLEFYEELIEVFKEYDEEAVKELMSVSIIFDEVLMREYPGIYEDYIEKMER